MKTSQLIFINVVLGLSGCAEWRTTPDAVDAHHGLAVRQMIENQTLYPEHAEQEQQVMTLDGRRSQGVLNSYQYPKKKESGDSEKGINIRINGN